MAKALGAYGWACFDRDPPAALAAYRGYESISHEHGWIMGSTSALVARAEAAHGDPRAALDACQRSLLAYAASGARSAARAHRCRFSPRSCTASVMTKRRP